MFYIETPANPTNAIVDLQMINELKEYYSKDDQEVLTVVDNTYMGPLWQHPLQFGADLVVYSATKYIGGHSDVIAGAVLGHKAVMKRVKTLRTFLGNMAGPWTGWLLLRSLETLKVRMEQQQSNAIKVADYLQSHPKVSKVHYLGMIDENSDKYELYKRQHEGPGAMVAFDIVGGEKEAFTFLNSLELISLAVSLGGTESLAEHPCTMTHSGVEPEYLKSIGVTPSLVRLSIGVENSDDLIYDLSQALEKVR
jgi:methionine-gamma-lyase